MTAINLKDEWGRATLILVLAKLYTLLASMAQALPQLSTRPTQLALFSVLHKANGTTIEFLANSVRKCIPSATEFFEKNHTKLNALTLAYKAAEGEADKAQLEQRRSALVTAVEGPSLQGRMYLVCTGPLGCGCEPTTEEVRG